MRPGRSSLLLALVGVVVPAVARAVPTPADASRLDLQHDTWMNVGIDGLFASFMDGGRLTLGTRLEVLPWLALRADAGLQYVQFDGNIFGAAQDATVLQRTWVGPELTLGWRLGDDLHLRIGGSLELGAPSSHHGAEVTYQGAAAVATAESWGVRGRAGVRLEGASSFVQVEALRAGALSTLAGLDDAADPFGIDTPEPHASALLASAYYQFDVRQAFAADATWDFDTTVGFGATYWFTFRRPTLGPRTWVSMRVGGTSDDGAGFQVGVNVLRQW